MPCSDDRSIDSSIVYKIEYILRAYLTMSRSDKFEFNNDNLCKWLCSLCKLLSIDELRSIKNIATYTYMPKSLYDWYRYHLEHDILTQKGDEKEISEKEMKRIEDN